MACEEEGIMSRILRWGWLVGLAIGLSACATVEIRETRIVRGVLTDAAGRPVAGNPVLVVGRTLELAAGRMEYLERGRRELATMTDQEGRYRLEFVPQEYGNNFFLFFDGASGFDRVRYAHPEPEELTERLKSAREIEVSRKLVVHPAWPEVERQIVYYGRTSDRGEILLRHGLPEKREPSRPGDESGEVWWYYADGVSYWFHGDRLERTHPFPPIRGVRP
jgi:hypothetical protein